MKLYSISRIFFDLYENFQIIFLSSIEGQSSGGRPIISNIGRNILDRFRNIIDKFKSNQYSREKEIFIINHISLKLIIARCLWIPRDCILGESCK